MSREVKTILEYVWIDGFNNLRSKTRVIKRHIPIVLSVSGPINTGIKLSDIPEWNFDGSSTGQATGSKSDIILKPVAFYKNPFYSDGFEKYVHDSVLVLCDTYNPDGTPHETNYRNKCTIIAELCGDYNSLFGIEQEYVIYETTTNIPFGWYDGDIPNLKYDGQGPYYCSVGGDVNFGRMIADKHLKYCLEMNLDICGINAEVMPSQYEFQLGPSSPLKICDELWIARYVLNKIAEEYGCWINYDPKPMKEWNGSGAHTNFSTKEMREVGGYDKIVEACEKMKNKHKEHLEEYGDIEGNKNRLTGIHETSSIDKFTYGVSDRGASVRIPLNVYNDKKGYLEDRRPSSNMNPYRVITRILRTVCLNE